MHLLNARLPPYRQEKMDHLLCGFGEMGYASEVPSDLHPSRLVSLYASSPRLLFLLSDPGGEFVFIVDLALFASPLFGVVLKILLGKDKENPRMCSRRACVQQFRPTCCCDDVGW